MANIHIPDSTLAEDDLIYQMIGYDRPRGTSYAGAWLKILSRTRRNQSYRRRVRAAINRNVPMNRRKLPGQTA